MVSLIASGGVLIVLAIPAFSLHLAVPGPTSLPQNLAVVKTYNKIQATFPGAAIPAVVAVRARRRDLAAGRRRDRRAARARRGQPAVQGARHRAKSTRRTTVAQVDIPIIGSGTDKTSERAIAALRDSI